MAYCEHCGAPLEQEAAPANQGVDPVAAAASAQAQSILDSMHAHEQAATEQAPSAAAAPVEQQAGTEQPAAQEQEAGTQQPAKQEAGQPEPDHTVVLGLIFPDGASYTVTNDATNIGRSDVAQNWHPELDLIPFGGGAPDLGVSRHQALIQRQDNGYVLIDVGSTNGTFVNGKALAYNKPVELHDGDAIAFGAFNARVSIR
jgi:pSer/pThr/pTyr-binding forkhead associated (FHA) protein